MKIAVLLSGGVDSSVALRLLHEEGQHELRAFYLKIWLEDELAFLGDCPWEDDLSYVRAVCEQLDVPLEVVPLQSEYFARVVSFAIDELKVGRTPSPDIHCNQHIKFGEFYSAIDGSFDRVATGHYAQRVERDGKVLLRQAPDPVKDQSYFLSRLSQAQLYRASFPIGHLQKHEVRELAQRFALPTQERKDSQGICFLGKIRYRDFVKFHLGECPGPIIEQETDTILGQHKGFWFHTIGQRQGLGLHGGPWYVVDKDIEANVVYVSHQQKSRDERQFTVANVHWIADPPASTMAIRTKLRHGPRMVSCELGELTGGRWSVTLAEGDPGIASGQSAVFYAGDICLGNGVIE